MSLLPRFVEISMVVKSPPKSFGACQVGVHLSYPFGDTWHLDGTTSSVSCDEYWKKCLTVSYDLQCVLRIFGKRPRKQHFGVELLNFG